MATANANGEPVVLTGFTLVCARLGFMFVMGALIAMAVFGILDAVFIAKFASTPFIARGVELLLTAAIIGGLWGGVDNMDFKA